MCEGRRTGVRGGVMCEGRRTGVRGGVMCEGRRTGVRGRGNVWGVSGRVVCVRM